MANSFNSEIGKVCFLTKKNVIDLHNLLSKNVKLPEKTDSVELPTVTGIKNIGVLESTVARQTTGFGNYFKYPDCFSNCASLIYGILKNNSFHNRNKQLGLISLIKHLYINGYVLNPQLNSEELYDFLLAITNSKIQQFSVAYKKKHKFIRNKKEKKHAPTWDIDTTIEYMAFWIKKNSCSKKNILKGDVKISDLKKTLEDKNIFLEQNGSLLEVYVEKENNILGIKLNSKKKKEKEYSIINNTSIIEKKILETLRNDFNLTKSNGIDNSIFYAEESFIDYEIKSFQKLFFRLY